jgi:hypothetical protein
MSQQSSESSQPLRPEVQWSLRGRLPALLFAISVAGIGGFVGGSIMSYGPHYVNIHVTEAFDRGEMRRASVAEPVGAVVAVAVETPDEVVAQPAPKAAEVALPAGAESRLVMQGKNRSYLVLDSSPKVHWGAGAKRVRGADFEFTLTQALDPDFVTPEIALWRDREVTLFSATGYSCTAKVSDFQLLQKSFEDGDGRESVFREFEPGLFQLVARVEPLRGNCAPAVWARDASLAPPAIARVGRAKKALRRLAESKFRASPDWKALQKRFAKEGGKGKWDSLWDTAPTIQSMRGASEELVMISATGGNCGEFEGALSIFYRVEQDGSLSQIASGKLNLEDVAAAADIDADGDLDFIGSRYRSETLLVRQNAQLEKESSSQVLINVCGC